jgi:ketosteroid isomerase-like protein
MILLRPGAALCLALLLGCDNPERPSVDVKELMRETLDAWESRSIANVAPHYSHTPGRLFFDAGPLKYTGWDAYAADAGPAFASFKAVTFALGDDAQGEQRGEMAWGATTVRSTFTLADGTTRAHTARWTTVWVHEDDRWVIAHDHYSVPSDSIPRATPCPSPSPQ